MVYDRQQSRESKYPNKCICFLLNPSYMNTVLYAPTIVIFSRHFTAKSIFQEWCRGEKDALRPTVRACTPEWTDTWTGWPTTRWTPVRVRPPTRRRKERTHIIIDVNNRSKVDHLRYNIVYVRKATRIGSHNNLKKTIIIHHYLYLLHA